MSSRGFWTQVGFIYQQSTPFQLTLQALSFHIFIHLFVIFLAFSIVFEKYIQKN